MDQIDINKLIVEIQARPAIWNMKHVDYANKSKKKNSWEEIALLFVNGSATSDEKKRIRDIVMKKWKHLRDRYAREVRERKGKSGQAATNKAPYMYAQQLSFLKDTIINRSTDSSMDVVEITNQSDNENRQLDDSQGLATPILSGVKSKKKSKLNPMEMHLLEALNNNATRREQKEAKDADDDRLFLMSLLPTLKQVPVQNKLNVRVAIMQCINNYTTNAMYVSMPSSSQQNLPFQQMAQNHQLQQPSYTQSTSTQLSVSMPLSSPAESIQSYYSNYSGDGSDLTLF